jgi:DNA-binding Xre family transcriptional regulator
MLRQLLIITYAPLWKVLERQKLPKGYLREGVGLSSMTVAKLFKNEPINFTVLDRICRVKRSS